MRGRQRPLFLVSAATRVVVGDRAANVEAARQVAVLDAHPFLAMGGILMLSMAVCTATALIVERICYRPFRHVATLAPLICAIGASFVIQHTFRGMFGSSVRSYPDPAWMSGRVELLGFSVPTVQPIVIGTALVAMLVLYLIVQKCAPSPRIAMPQR